MNEELKRKIHEVIKDCAFARDFASGLITMSPRTLEKLIFDAIDGAPTSSLDSHRAMFVSGGPTMCSCGAEFSIAHLQAVDRAEQTKGA
jgi:hypothetical protein